MAKNKFKPVVPDGEEEQDVEQRETFQMRRIKSKTEWGVIGLLYFSAFILFIIYFDTQLREFNRAGTATSVSVSTELNLDFPTITICNLEAGVPINYRECVLPDGSFCQGVPRTDLGVPFECASFNADYKNVERAKEPGLKGLLTIKFWININLYPANAGLFGAQVVLHEPGTRPNIDKSGFFVAPGRGTILQIHKTITEHINGSRSNNWDATPSTLAIDDTISTAYDTIVLGLMYRELTTTRITEIHAYSTGQLLGALSGIASGLFQVAQGLVIALGILYAIRLRHLKRKNKAIDLAELIFQPKLEVDEAELTRKEEISSFVSQAKQSDTSESPATSGSVALPAGLRATMSRAKQKAAAKHGSPSGAGGSKITPIPAPSIRQGSDEPRSGNSLLNSVREADLALIDDGSEPPAPAPPLVRAVHSPDMGNAP